MQFNIPKSQNLNIWVQVTIPTTLEESIFWE